MLLRATILILVVLSATNSSHAQTMEGVDFALDWRSLVGKRVTVIGTRVFSADAERAAVNIQGGMIHLKLAGVPRETIRSLILNCNMSFDDKACRYNVTGTVERMPILDTPTMSRIELQSTTNAEGRR